MVRHELGGRAFRLFEPSRWEAALSEAPKKAPGLPCKPKYVPEIEVDHHLLDLIDGIELELIEMGEAGFDYSLGLISTAHSVSYAGASNLYAMAKGGPLSGTVATVWHPGETGGGTPAYPTTEMDSADPVPVPPAAPIFLGGLGAFVLTKRRPRRDGPARAQASTEPAPGTQSTSPPASRLTFRAATKRKSDRRLR